MKKFIAVLAIPFVMVACGKKSNPIENIKQATEDRDLQKTFQSSCSAEVTSGIIAGIKTALQATVLSSRTLYSFKGDNIERKTVYYSGKDCDGEAYSMVESGTFSIGSKHDKTNDGGRPIDISYDKLVVTPLSDDGTKIANSEGVCGINNWETGKGREIKSNVNSVNCDRANIPRQDSNVYRVDAGNLYMGSFDQAVRQSNQRPASLSSSKYEGK